MKITYRAVTYSTLLILTVSSFSYAAMADELYKWVDDRGRVTYQSTPPPQGAMDVEMSTMKTEQKVEDAEQGVPDKILPIVFYTKPECPVCDDARDYFEANNIPTTEVNISENKAEAEKMEKQLGHNEVPTAMIGNKSITGFKKKMLNAILKNSGYEITETKKEEQDKEENQE